MASETSSHFMNPIVSSLAANFLNFVNEQVELHSNQEVSLQHLFEQANEGQFSEIIGGLACVATHYPGEVINWLIKWYNETIPRTESMPRDSTTSMRDSVAAFNASHIIDASFLLCLKEIFYEHQKSLEKGLAKTILTMIYKILLGRFNFVSQETLKENLFHINKVVYEIIDSLAAINLADVEQVFFAELNSAQTTPSQSAVILTLRGIHIKVFSIDHVEGVFNILSACSKHLIKCKDKEVRSAFITMFSEILLCFAATAKTELNIPAVINFVEGLNSYANNFLKKAKYSQLALHFSTALLCCSTKKAFFANYYTFVCTLMQFVKSKDINIIKVAIECLDKVVWVYMVRFRCEGPEETSKFLNYLNTNLFATSRTTLLTEFSHILVKIIHSISQARVNFALNDIVKEFCSAPPNKHFSPEKMSIGLKAFILIVDSNPKKEIPEFLPVNDTFYQTNRFSTIKKVFSNRDIWLKIMDDPEKKLIKNSFYHTLFYLDGYYGRPFLKTNPTSLQKYQTEQANAEKKQKILLFKQCIASVPKFLVTDDIVNELSESLTRLSLHVDADLQTRAFAVLKLLLVEYPSLRSNIIYGITHTYLCEIPFSCTEIITEAMTNVHKLVQLWRTCLSNDNAEASGFEGFYSLEGFCLVNLCSSLVSHRSLACQILKENKSVLAIFAQSEATESSVYDEIYKYLIERCSLRFDMHSNVELNKLLEQSFPMIQWYQVWAYVLRDSKIPYNCPSAINFARISGFSKFISVHTLLESFCNYVEPSPRLSLGRPKKLPNYCDTQSWQNYFTLFCAPANFEDNNKSGSTESSTSQSYFNASGEVAKNVSSAFDKAVSLLKVDYNQIREMSTDALCFCHSTAIPLFFRLIEPLIKDLNDPKSDYNTKKKKKRDIIVTELLDILSCWVKSGNLRICIEKSEVKVFSCLLEFCENCRNVFLLSLENINYPDKVMDQLAVIISCICCALYNSNRHNLIHTSSREQYYKTFLHYFNEIENKSLNEDVKEHLVEAMFSLLYAENILYNKNFSIKTRDIINMMTNAYVNNFLKNKSLILDTIENLLHSNSYIPELLEYAIEKLYTVSNQFSRNLFFILLDYFDQKLYDRGEPKSYFQGVVRLLTMVLIHTFDMDTVIYLRLRKTLSLLQKKFNIPEKVKLLFPQRDDLSKCQIIIQRHIMHSYSNYIMSITSELFKIFPNCGFSFRVNILLSFQMIFKYFRLTNHPDYTYTNSLLLIINDSTQTYYDIEFTTAIFLLNNLLYVTKEFTSFHSVQIKDCWISISCFLNSNYLFTLHYLTSLAQYECLNNLVKTVLECIYSFDSNILYTFLVQNLINEQNPKLNVNFEKIYPYVAINCYSITNKTCEDKKLISASSLPSQGDSNENQRDSTNTRFFCYSLCELSSSTEIIPYHSAYLICASYIASNGSISIDENYFSLLHLGINDMFNSNSLISSSCKRLVVCLCMVILNASTLPEETKSSMLIEWNALLCSIQNFSTGRLFSFRKTTETEDSSTMVTELSKLIESIHSYLNIESATQTTANPDLHVFMKKITSYFEFCEFFSKVETIWCNAAVIFATKCSSVSISCYSLYVLRTLGCNLKFEHFKRLIDFYCNTLFDSSPDIKRLSHEMLVTIQVLSTELIKKYSTLIKDNDKEYKLILTMLVWFFSYNFVLEIQSDILVCINFFLELLYLSSEHLDEIFRSDFLTVTDSRYLLFIIINYLMTTLSYQEQSLLVLIRLAPYTASKFVCPDSKLGIILITIVLAYFYIDYFEGPLEEISKSFTIILDTLALISSMERYYTIFHMFRRSSKRKDVSLFTNVLMPVILDKCNKIFCDFLMKFLIDVVELSDIRCIRNGLLLLCSLIDHAGSHNIPRCCSDFLLANLPKYIKINAFSKISYEVSCKAFSTDNNEDTSCPHRYMNSKFNDNNNYQCAICSTVNEEQAALHSWILSNRFFFRTDVNLFENAIVKFFENFEKMPQTKSFQQLDKVVTGIPLECDIRIQYPYNESPPIDTYSMNSTQMIDDILDTLNYLDKELENTNSRSSTVRRTQRLRSMSFLTKPQRKVYNKLSVSDTKSEEILYSPTSHNKGPIHHVFSVSEDCIDRLIEQTALESIFSSSHDVSGQAQYALDDIHEISKDTLSDIIITESPIDSDLNELIKLIYFNSDYALLSEWDKYYCKCIDAANKKDFIQTTFLFTRLNFLLPILIHRLIFVSCLMLKDFYLHKDLRMFINKRVWLKTQLNKVEKKMDKLVFGKNFPYFILHPNLFTPNFLNDKIFSMFLRLSISANNILSKLTSFQSYLKEEVDISWDSVNSLILNTPTGNKSALYINLLSNNEDKSTNYNSHECFIFYTMFEVFKSLLEVNDFYNSYLENIRTLLENNHATDITESTTSQMNLEVKVLESTLEEFDHMYHNETNYQTPKFLTGEYKLHEEIEPVKLKNIHKRTQSLPVPFKQLDRTKSLFDSSYIDYSKTIVPKVCFYLESYDDIISGNIDNFFAINRRFSTLSLWRKFRDLYSKNLICFYQVSRALEKSRDETVVYFYARSGRYSSLQPVSDALSESLLLLLSRRSELDT